MPATLNSHFGSRCRPGPERHSLDAGPTKTVLLVDDNQDDIFLLGHALSPVLSSCRLFTAADGVEAEHVLERLEDQEESALPWVIFTDINMPRENGFQLLQWLKQRPGCASIPVVMVSSFDDPADLEKARALGAVACLRKPPEAKEAQRLTASLMHRCQEEKQVSHSLAIFNADAIQNQKAIHKDN